MSFWDRYLAPGDIRLQRQQLEVQHQRAEQQAIQDAISKRPRPPVVRIDAATRARRQNGLLFGGIIFSAFSVIVTRRVVARKILKTAAASTPATTTSATPDIPPNVAASLDAAQALSLATLNVFSMGMLGLGIAAKAMDIADVEDLRNLVRRGAGFDVYGGDEQADKELEQWVAETLMSKDGVFGLKESVAAKLAELQKLEEQKRDRST